MRHPTEEELVLYHYGEAPDAAALRQHLEACDTCRREYGALRQVLAAVAATPVPARDEAYPDRVWMRLRPRLAAAQAEAEAERERRGVLGRWLSWLPERRWAHAAAMATLLVAAFLAGRVWQRSAGPVTQSARSIPAEARERILLVTVGEHLEQSQMVLIELMNAGTAGKGPVDISAEQQWADELVDANRLYRQTASGAGNAPVAGVLEELERVLMEIAHSPSQLSGPQLERLRQDIEAKGILFKVRVVGSKLREQAGPPAAGAVPPAPDQQIRKGES